MIHEKQLSRAERGQGGLFPELSCKRSRKGESEWVNVKQPTEQSIRLEILDIDSSLSSKSFSCHLGLLFSREVSEKVVADLFGCLKRHTAILEDGFSLWSSGKVIRNRSVNSQSKRLSQKIDTLN
jgi:hypothetical protein